MPLPYPHRATFLATTLVVPASLERLSAYLARLISVIVFDHLIRHPIVTLGDDDERLVADDNRLLDAHHPQAEDTIDWLFRVSRRHEVLWLQLSLDAARPSPALLYARRPSPQPAGGVDPTALQPVIEQWIAPAEVMLSQQLSSCIAQWLATRRMPGVGALPDFTLDDLRSAAGRLANADAVLAQRAGVASVPPSLTQPPPRLAVPYLRVLAELSRDAARTFDPLILAVDPTHPVARRNHYVSGLLRGDTERREILPLVDEAPMYGKPHLSIWGEPFAADRPVENMGVRHQGIAASLMPANAYACHNYSLQLAEVGRREESYRWADRATVAAPQFGAAHLDCVRRLRQVGRPGQAFAEAQYRCREILDRDAAKKLPPADWQAPHHAALLIAFAHLDVGRIAEAIELADDALARVPDDAATREAFAWASKRISHWKTDAGLLARAYAWEGYHRGDPGRAIAGLTRGRISDDDDAAMLVESLIAVGREDQARLAYAHCAGLDGSGQLGDGKARLAAARALILAGELDDAMDQIQIVQLRRGQSRFEAEVNRLLRLAAIRPAADWERVIERRLDRGALRLAKLAARDLADFVPGLAASQSVARALGPATAPVVVDDDWFEPLLAALPAATATSAAILQRLTWPAEDSLRAADLVAQEWWSVLVPPARDRDAHAAGVVLAAGVALARYLAATTRAPSPVAGGFRHVATEALHLVRRSRYQIDPGQIAALLGVVEHLAGVPEPLLDTWLLRVERALDLEAEQGSYLDHLTADLPTVKRLLRGDERTGWELRLAHDLGRDPSQYEPAAMLFERCARAVEGGTVTAAWSAIAGAAAPPQTQLDVHWLAAYGNPNLAAPWLRVAHGLLATGRTKDGVAAAVRGMTVATVGERAAALAELAPRWKAANVATPLHGETAFEAGLAAASEDRLDVAIQHLRWAAAVEPGNARRAQSLAVALAKSGSPHDAVRVLAAHERTDAPRLIGRVLVDANRPVEAVAVLRYAARRFRAPEDWALLAIAARRADNDAVVVEAGRRAVQLGGREHDLLVALATSLYRLGEFADCEAIAHQLILDRTIPRDAKIAGLHAMARALAGQGRHVDAHPYAKGAGELGPNGELAADLIETMDRIVAQQTPPVRTSSEATPERKAFADLEAGRLSGIEGQLASPSWAVVRAALCACEFRRDDESGIPVAPRALDAAVAVLDRTLGATTADAVLARCRALRIRDNAFIQIDPPPPLGLRFSTQEFERQFAERSRRPQRPSAIYSAVR
jgi:tetratricopeptide (TPR) repeat protein